MKIRDLAKEFIEEYEQSKGITLTEREKEIATDFFAYGLLSGGMEEVGE